MSLAAILATLWFAPAVSAVGGVLVTLLFGGDGGLAFIVGATLAAAVLAQRLLGGRAAAGVLAAGGLIFAHRSGIRRGTARQAEQEKADAARAIEKAGRARTDADRRNADARRLRDDDGFRRDDRLL